MYDFPMANTKSEIHQRTFDHAANPEFHCRENVILLPFGRRNYLPAIGTIEDSTIHGFGQRSMRGSPPPSRC